MTDGTTNFFSRYTKLVPDGDALAALVGQVADTLALLRGVPDDQAGVLHPPYTWTIRQVVGHLIDGERVFAYRALRFARGDATPLPGFDENAYAAAAESDRIPLAELAAEFEAVRRATVLMFRHLPPAAWARRGVANGADLGVRELALAIAGHELHHAAILRRRLASG